MKKIISLILCLLMLLSTVSMTALADDTYEFFEKRQAIASYNAEAPAELVIPSEINGLVVESILDSSFTDNAAAVEKLTLPEFLMFISDRNFNKSPALAEVNLPETLQVVGEYVFRESAALTEITIPAAVTMIGNNSFAKNENLKSVTFTGMAPLYVGNSAFGSNHPEMVIYVPDDQIAAYIAVLPEGLNIQPSGANAVVVDYTAAEELFTFDAATGTITASACRTPRVDIPATIGGVPVTAIGAGVFKESNYVCCIIVPDGVTTIGDEAFASCVFLDYVDLPDSVTTIGVKAFNGYQGIVFEFPAQLQTIGDKAFAYSKIEVVVLPVGLTSIGANAFQKCYASEIILPYTLTTIGDKAFSECEYITTITIPSSVTGIGAGAFDESDRLEEVIIECDASIVPADAFVNCKKLKTINVLVGTDSAVVAALAAATGAEVKAEVEAAAAPVPAAEPTSEPVAEAVNADNGFVGSWISDDGATIVLYADGTGLFTTASGTLYDKTWVVTDGACEFTDWMWEGSVAVLDDANTLNIDNGWFVFTRNDGAPAEAPVEAPVEAPAAAVAAVAGTAEDFIGTWTAVTMDMGGMVMNVADMGMTMQLTINGDGTASMYDGESTDTAAWTLADGALDIDGMLLTLTEDGQLCMSEEGMAAYFVKGEAVAAAPETTPAESVDLASSPVIGVWNDGEGITFTVNADGTCVATDEWGDSNMGWEIVDGVPTITTGSWFGAPMIINEDGTLYVNDGFFVDKTLVPGAYVQPVVDLSGSPVIGVWNDGESITFTVNADGTCVATESWGDNNMEWTIEDGVPMIVSGSWYGAPMILNDDGTLYVNDGWIIDATFTRGELAAGATEPVISGAVAGAAEDYVGSWKASTMDMGGMVMNVADIDMVMDLTITADGMITMFDGEYTETATWTLIDGVLDVMGEMQLNLTEDGRLCMAEDGIMLYFVRGEGGAPVPGEPVAEVVPVVGKQEDFAGRWIGQTFEMSGQSFALSEMGMTMEIEFGVYGNVTLFDGEYSETGFWTLVDGKADIDGMICTLMSDGTLVAEDADGVKVVFSGLVGTWKACYMSTGGLTGDPRTMGITSTLVLNADGTGSIDFPTAEEGFWYREEGILRFGEYGMPVTVLPGGFLKYGSDLAGYMVFTQDDNATWDPSMEAVEPAATPEPVVTAVPAQPAQEPVSGGAMDLQARMNCKFVAKTYTAYGQTMDASMLGAEYSMQFREDGTCDFGIAGMVVSNLPWGLQKIAVGLNEVDAFVINYYGTMFNAVLTDTGFDLDYYGTMTLHYELAE